MRTALILLLSITILSAVFSQNVNVTHNATMTFNGQNLANIWGYAAGGNEYALVGAKNGLIIVNVTDPNNPQQIVQIPGLANDWREIKTYSHYAYVVSEAFGSKIQIVDLDGLPGSNLTYHTVDGGSGIQRSHALHIDETKGYLYVYGSNLNSGRPQVYDLNSDPYNPTYVGFVNFIGYVHDGYVDNDRLYSAHILAGQVAVINMTNKTSPSLLATFNTPNNFPHNTWLSGNTLFTTDEVSNSYLTAYDVSNLGNITELDKIQITPGSGSIVHNTHILNDYAVTSWYKDGFAIIDVARPANMVAVGRYDTYPGGSGDGFEGCWGVYPYLPSGTIVASNIEAQNTSNGELWVLTPNYVRGCYLEGTVTDAISGFPLNAVDIQVLSTTTFGRTDAQGLYKLGQLQNGAFTVRMSKTGYVTQEHQVSLDNGVLTLLNVALLPQGALPVELTRFDVRLDGNDAVLTWETASEINNAGFEIQQSSNSGSDWRVRDFVLPQGDGTAPAFYTYRIPGLEPGTHFFRLRQTDRDGKSSFSPMRSLVVYSDRLHAALWPNPAAGQSTVHVVAGRSERVQVEIWNANQQPTGISMSVDVAPDAQVPLDLTSLPAGIYTVRVWDATDQTQLLLVKK